MPVKKKRDYRTGTITQKEAADIFNQYYKDNTSSLIGEFRGKIFDMLYQKKMKFTIKCNDTKKKQKITNSKGDKEILKPGQCEKGSIKYSSAKGPKTFDVVGIDSFPEGTKFRVPGDKKKTVYTAKGYSLIKQIDKITKVVESSAKVNKKSKKIYGPRISTDDELYSSKFRKALKKRETRFKNEGGLKDDTTSEILNLVDLRWKQARKPSKKSKTYHNIPGEGMKLLTKTDSVKIKAEKKAAIAAIKAAEKVLAAATAAKKPTPVLYPIHIGYSSTDNLYGLEDSGISGDKIYIIEIEGSTSTLKYGDTPVDKRTLEYSNQESFIKAIKLKVKGKFIDNIGDIKHMEIKLHKIGDDEDGEDEYDFILDIQKGFLLEPSSPKNKLYKNLEEFYKSTESDYEIVQSKKIDL